MRFRLLAAILASLALPACVSTGGHSAATGQPGMVSAADPRAAATFATLKGCERYSVLYRLHGVAAAKRQSAVAKVVEALAGG